MWSKWKKTFGQYGNIAKRSTTTVVPGAPPNLTEMPSQRDPDRNAFPKFISDAINPVSETLTDNTLLEKCAHRGTQNTNESYHNLIWQHCSKTNFVGRTRLRLAVADAAIVWEGWMFSRSLVSLLVTNSRGADSQAENEDFYLSGAHE